MRCADCGDDFDEDDIVVVKQGHQGEALRGCFEVRQEEGAMAEEAEGAMRGMMEYKGGW